VKHLQRVTLLGVLGTALLFAGTASAAKPFRGSFDDTQVYVDSEVCAAAPWGFDVNVVQHTYGFFEIFSFNPDGSEASGLAHINLDATISANGKTIVERDTWEATAYPDGSFRFTGSTVHIQGPGGIVVRDAGQVVFNADRSVNYAHGPHPVLIDGVSFCPALAP
jgi:hypothetical protein